MAKQTLNTAQPVDKPIKKSAGVRYKESDFFAQDCSTYERRGFARDQTDGTSAVGKQNGQREDGKPQQEKRKKPYRKLR